MTEDEGAEESNLHVIPKVNDQGVDGNATNDADILGGATGCCRLRLDGNKKNQPCAHVAVMAREGLSEAELSSVVKDKLSEIEGMGYGVKTRTPNNRRGFRSCRSDFDKTIQGQQGGLMTASQGQGQESDPPISPSDH